ncbi:DNA/RNA non-specific endonuclease [Larsenimonas rhizosphaerae]|uniref:DNA/RNA non-specific endonuclease n=1 Tax=Larsenimonas rhizosphaerae TaxID=2944682 RepID=UPI002033FAD6|nr:DNA/RNA non-specific endonuclease [Larsenimonas rhizosphaerae]MCM2129547.1 DNA/RNA non-specific endonuclease [Larsenimonas rhizosphaerae]
MSASPVRLADLTPIDPTPDPTSPSAVASFAPAMTPGSALEGRTGYNADFLEGFTVPMPVVTDRAPGDVTPVDGRDDGRLDYTHFSIVMNRPRRLAFFTAFNLDGSQLRSIRRGNDRWVLDSRIPADAQCGEALYARNPLDRGHLVRRSAACWGTLAEQANQDTFHFTNCTPQMAAFNQQTWLGLEDYLKDNAARGSGRLSIFTGPVFKDSDRTYRGVRIPEAFWKVVAFIRDDGRQSATAYLITQDRELNDGLGLFFGQYQTFQKSILHIETLTGLDFGPLSHLDGFSNEERATGTRVEAVIHQLGDIRV